MKKSLLGTGLAALLAATPALGDGKIYVQLPDLSQYSGAAAEALLMQVVMANVISGNCQDYAVTDEEWSLLVDSADILARGQLGLSIDDYDELYYGPAFKALDEKGICEREGPNVEAVLDQLVELGGSREALPDQDKAYQDWSAVQASWDAEPASTGKSKSK